LEIDERIKIVSIIGLLLIVMFVLFSCAPGPNELEKTTNTKGKVAGFWKGLWHGLIVPITFIISIFSNNVRLYEVHNSGLWYNFGFTLGVAIIFSGGILGSKKRKA
jgi:ABC-type multidrug transport system permease subunit